MFICFVSLFSVLYDCGVLYTFLSLQGYSLFIFIISVYLLVSFEFVFGGV